MGKHTIKREDILQAGLTVMHLHGYNGTGIQDIVKKAGIPKGSFYNYFNSKEEFAIAALQHVADGNLSAAKSMLLEGNTPPLERLQAFFRQGLLKAECSNFKLGCLMGNLCQELADVNEPVRETVSSLFQRLTIVFSQCLAEAQARGELPANRDVDKLADFLFNAWEGALLRMKCEKSPAPLEDFLQNLPYLLRH